jgi:arsenate reductase
MYTIKDDMNREQPALYTALNDVVENWPSALPGSGRSTVLQPLIDHIRQVRGAGKPVLLNFICTHNSRRSQFAQIWAQTAADYYGISARCYSGGVEVTAFNERAVASIERMGFRVSAEGKGNPVYTVRHSDSGEPIVAFSKLYNDPVNPAADFAAVMTCSHADEHCPFIPGASVRIPVTYEDPKAYDGTDLESARYDERCRQIGAEMWYVFSKISSNE